MGECHKVDKGPALERVAEVAVFPKQETDLLPPANAMISGDPTKLEQMGWGKRNPALPRNTPNQPRAVDAIMQGPGTVYLDWKTPIIGGNSAGISVPGNTAAVVL
ncbi:MAG TPA: hypothetical protein PLI09_00880 [Candidatus Hydrogenedentes bacterium]|nr:hypothetical protein [Candidatus Hydrogenedentota bacterium]